MVDFEIEKLSVFGNPNIGVYLFANNHYAIVPSNLDEDSVKIIERTLKVQVVKISVVSSPLIGLFLAGNDHAILVPYIIKDYELNDLRSQVDMKVHVLQTKLTALGNVILANNSYAYVHPELRDVKDRIKEMLGVEVEEKEIAMIPTVGSAAVVNNKGGVIHPEASEQEAMELKEKFKLSVVGTATVNEGIPYVKTGLVANDKGALVGEQTTPIEMAHIERILSGRE
ncbi:translation initiation factor IF-6 [Ignicoccus islandicus DSM 13165]|uniref:Translation initiation factor 6 n=1 Tax=Ignicoccus islandicus DSM 13165 TaxID=940295 RepID=A0A0U3FJA4_9CREN|nr:translation initiation factor IF-6 [Ignicoccus islandicus]ALU11958.1 translation initiation factor IF-6 [Ignicoccus islandicus DSM 13165]